MLSLFLLSCGPSTEKEATGNTKEALQKEKLVISNRIDQWHTAAGEADYDAYFDLMAENAIFIGTDPTENWEVEEFREWAKPYFDAGKAWAFTPIERNLYLKDGQEVAWFDELLETQMGLCRGSGILEKEDGEWKIKHYVLSIAIPNDQVDEVTSLKRDFDLRLMDSISGY